MNIFSLIKKNTYFDSVTLMGISKRLNELEDVLHVSVSMGTELNRALLQDSGMQTPETAAATPNDLMIVFSIEQAERAEAVLAEVEKALTRRKTSAACGESRPAGLKTALDMLPDATMAVISLPGEYAAFEARKALRSDLHVMLFSDNVSLEDEVALKNLAHEKGLLLMGPDCGTAIINGKALCFANVVNRGRVGVVGASGTGTQEVTVLLDSYGLGVSQVIGTGGRDLHKSVNALMMCDALTALAADPETDLILLVSKPPEQAVAEKVCRLAREAGKPVLVCFLQEGPSAAADGNLHFANTLEEGALKVASLLLPGFAGKAEPVEGGEIGAARQGLGKGQNSVRGVFCGGTLTDEARIIFKSVNPKLPCQGNTAKVQGEKLADPHLSVGNCFVDMGDDAFTVGKPHPMIAPELRSERIVQEAADPETAVILFDVVLGYGSHPDPAGIVLEGIEQARRQAQGRKLVFVGYVLGTDRDPQHMPEQVRKLKAAGVILGKTNAHAARIAAEIIKGVQ